MILKKAMSSLAILLSVVLFSCSKDDVIPGTEPEKFIEVQFTENAVPLNSVDSVFAIFKIPGSTNTVKRKMLLARNNYATSAQDLPAATYAVEFNVYVKKQPGTAYSYLYKLKKNVTLPLTAADKNAGPNGLYAGNWAPYFVFRNEGKNVSLVVAERVDDPYFEITAPQLAGYKLTGLDRSTFGGDNASSYLADHDNWISPNNPLLTGFYSNNSAFSQFAERMKTKDWYKAELDFMLDDTSNDPVYFHHIYFKRN